MHFSFPSPETYTRVISPTSPPSCKVTLLPIFNPGTSLLSSKFWRLVSRGAPFSFFSLVAGFIALSDLEGVLRLFWRSSNSFSAFAKRAFSSGVSCSSLSYSATWLFAAFSTLSSCVSASAFFAAFFGVAFLVTASSSTSLVSTAFFALAATFLTPSSAVTPIFAKNSLAIFTSVSLLLLSLAIACNSSADNFLYLIRSARALLAIIVFRF